MQNTRLRIRAETGVPPAPLSLERSADGHLSARVSSEPRIVYVQRCFPWSDPERFISLRDDDGNELALVPDPAYLNAHTRVALETALAEAGFIFDLQSVTELDEEVELRNWHVHTSQGPRRFQTRLDDWPRKLPDGGLLIRDVTGDFYRIADPALLDRESRALLWAFVD